MSVPEIAFSPSDLIRWRSHLKASDKVIWYPNGIVTLINRNAQSGTWDVTGDQILGVRSAPEHDLRPMPGTNNRAKPPIDAPPVEDVQPMPDVDADVTPMTPFRALPVSRDAEEAPLMVVDATYAPKTQPAPPSAAQSKRRGAR